MLFQMMFAVITPALITGAFAERMKFSAFLRVHPALGDARLRPARPLGLGRRRLAPQASARSTSPAAPSCTSPPASRRSSAALVHRQAPRLRPPADAAAQPDDDRDRRGLLWFGWFGFNAGSALAANGLAAHAFVTTNTAPRRPRWAGCSPSGRSRGKPTVLGAASGAVAGLVAITPAAGFVDADGGDRHRGGGRACSATRRATSSRSSATTTRSTWSACTASAAPGARSPPASSRPRLINDAGGDGLFYGNPGQLWIQFVAVLVTWVLAS